MSDLRAMLIEARGERRAGDMVHLRVAEVDALIERLTPEPDSLGVLAPLSDDDAASVLAMGKALGDGRGLNGPEIEMLTEYATALGEKPAAKPATKTRRSK